MAIHALATALAAHRLIVPAPAAPRCADQGTRPRLALTVLPMRMPRERVH